MYQLELFENVNDATNPVWNQVDATIKKEIVTRLGRLTAKAVQEKSKRVTGKEDEHDKF